MLDLSTIPWSRFGSYMAISELPEHGLCLRSVRGPGLTPWQVTFALEVRAGAETIPYRTTAEPALLHLQTADGAVDCCFPEADVLRIRCTRTALRLTRLPSGYDFALQQTNGDWTITICGDFETKYRLVLLSGKLSVTAPWTGLRCSSLVFELEPDPATGCGELALEEVGSPAVAHRHTTSFADCLAQTELEWQRWLAATLPIPPPFTAARTLAAYLTWSCVVAPAGQVTRPAMYMSKNNMASIWSWDNCFNALALAPSHPALAWDQLMIMVDHQASDGAFPDLLNDVLLSRSFCKPPIYGWTIQKLLALPGGLTIEQIQEMYEPLCRNTLWWLSPCASGSGLPAYDHGNDSGWDNSTLFLLPPPLESPDLAAFLVLQLETLAELAQRLERSEEAAQWQVRAASLLTRLLDRFWRHDHFVALRAGDLVSPPGDSLQLFLPLILGMRLPPSVRRHLVTGLQAPGRFLTPFGLATESAQSPYYQPDGYWRGPIWGAPMLMLIDGLHAIGEQPFAQELARRFCTLCAQSGMAENYDALTGAPLRDRAFTWTSSLFLLLAHGLR
jgi:putative isomerase